MDIQAFGVEEWLNVWEKEAVYDIAGSSIASLTFDEILEMGELGKQALLDQLFVKKWIMAGLKAPRSLKQKWPTYTNKLTPIRFFKQTELRELIIWLFMPWWKRETM